jgi:hypothetical protein
LRCQSGAEFHALPKKVTFANKNENLLDFENKTLTTQNSATKLLHQTKFLAKIFSVSNYPRSIVSDL